MDSFEQQAAEIKANPGDYRELERITCDCSQPYSTLAVVYAGDGGQMWLWAAGGRGATNHPEQSDDGPITPQHFLPRAVPLPRVPGDVAHSVVASCPRCRRGRLLLPDVGVVHQVQLGAPTWARVTE
ncbi:hypothetical protein Pme01_17690 [Planosporangium mesophilum]|uniref:Uncharacterized protein n=1 Tax=Planosporangium mesophilum TaxID=689768 RepID=A0A8J3TA95_9ACTN|nr:hypothetical protein Pme01_17690 [Planosporangium mesophilum]